MIHLICPNPALDRTLLIEKFYKNKPVRPIEVRDYPGGKSFNVAYSLQKNKFNDYVIHTILGGSIGSYVENLNVELNHKLVVTKNSQNTRTCSIFVEQETNDTFLVYEKGFNLTDELCDEFTKKLEDSLKPNDVVVFSGTLMKGMADTYIKDIIEKRKDIRVIVDTSGAALKEAYKTNPYFLKINNEELKELYPEIDEESVENILDVLKTKTHLENVIITLGKQGCLAKVGNDFYRVTNPKIEAKNPIASGDFYLGVISKGLVNGEKPEQYLKEATAYATANCLEYFPYVDDEKFEQIKTQVVVERV